MEDLAGDGLRTLPRARAGRARGAGPGEFTQDSLQGRLSHHDHERPPREGYAELRWRRARAEELGKSLQLSEGPFRRQDRARPPVSPEPGRCASAAGQLEVQVR